MSKSLKLFVLMFIALQACLSGAPLQPKGSELCPQPPQGPPGPEGPVGPAGPEGPEGPAGVALLDHISSFSSSETTTALVADDPVPFGLTPQTSFGTSITQAGDTFSFSETGHYRVTATLQSDLNSTLGGVILELDGVPIGPEITLVAAGGNLVLDEIIQVEDPSLLEVVVTGLGLTLAAGDSSTITITRISDLAAP